MKDSQQHDTCPVCDSGLQETQYSYATTELFELWTSIHRFSEEIIADHYRQSEYTRLYRCSQCRLEIFLPQIVGTPFFYNELQGDPSAAYYVEEKWDFEEALKDAQGCDSIIEIGCGPGSFLSKAQAFVPKVVGVEYHKGALLAAREKGLEVFGSDEDISDMRGRFDAAFCFHVLEHVADPLEFFKELCSWVKPGGRVCLSVPNQDGPIKYIEPCIMNMPPHHATRWHAKTFKVLTNRLGMKIARMTFEPLITRDSYYYSTYWVSSFLSGTSRRSRLYRRKTQKVLSICFDVFFKILRWFNRTSFRFLKSQSLCLSITLPTK